MFSFCGENRRLTASRLSSRRDALPEAVRPAVKERLSVQEWRTGQTGGWSTFTQVQALIVTKERDFVFFFRLGFCVRSRRITECDKNSPAMMNPARLLEADHTSAYRETRRGVVPIHN
jgi:hypothetical protein